MLRLILPALVLILASLPTGKAHAVFDGDTIRIYGVGTVGFSGTMTDTTLDQSADLGPSFGFAVGGDFGLHDFVAVGLQVGWDSLKLSDDALDDLNASVGGMVMDMNLDLAGTTGAFTDNRMSILDVAVYPRVRLPLPIVEPYVMVPVGYATLSPPEGDSQSGMSLGLTAGLGLSMFPFVKMVGQVGYQMYYFDDVDVAEVRANLGLAVGF